MDKKQFAVECTAENAPKFAEWIATRGGLARWQSVDLSDPSASCTTPVCNASGTKNSKPHWKYGNEPTIITDPAQVGVFTEVLYKAFPVALKRGGFMGTKYSLTDAAQRKVNRIMAECEEKFGDAFYRKGVLDIDDASIGVFYTGSIVPLSEWKP